jgi:glycerate dehydrogenase
VRIVVLDGATLDPGDNPWDALEALGELRVYDRSTDEQIVPRARDATIVLTNKTPLSATTLAQLPELRFIAVLATGYDVVDVGAARARGIAVSNVPEYGTDSVAQHTIALLLELCHGVGEHDAAVRSGEWTRATDFCFWHRAPVELAGLTMGIVGLGRIGRRVAELAHALGMAVIASGSGQASAPRPAPGFTPFAWRSTAELFRSADVVSLHCPLGAANQRFVNDALLGSMKRTAFLVNTARGGLIDEPALARALHEGRIAGAALDVVSGEPIEADNPLLHAPCCVLTPHLAWASLAARRRLMAATADNVAAFIAGRPIHLVS